MTTDLLHHLLLDRALKAAIVLAALTALTAGLTTLWRRTTRRH